MSILFHGIHLAQFIRGGQGESDPPSSDRKRVAPHDGEPRRRQTHGPHVIRIGVRRERRGQPEDGDVVGESDGGHQSGNVCRVRPVVGEVDPSEGSLLLVKLSGFGYGLRI